MSVPYSPPKLQESGFNCPLCQAFSHFHWSSLFATPPPEAGRGGFWNTSFFGALCQRCQGWNIWTADGVSHDEPSSRMIFPEVQSAPPPLDDLPRSCLADYVEARLIASRSPRAAAALLRLCIQKICKVLGEPGKDLNSDIRALVTKGLDPKMQKALDIVRVTGNNSVHPGVMAVSEEDITVDSLFRLVNYIVTEMISKPRELDALYSNLPQSSLDAIAKRDDKP